jgi:hypothetical protein
MNKFLLACLALLPLLATAAPRLPEEMLRGRNAQYQQGFRDGFREAVRMMNGGGGGGGQQTGLRINSATYGGESRRCDFTARLAKRANGRTEYVLRVNNSLCGDPAPGREKTAVVQYRCGRTDQTATIREGRSGTLRCR